MDYLKKVAYRVKFEGADAPLPFSVRSAGHYCHDKNWEQYQEHRNFVQLFWVIRGNGVIRLDEQEFELEEDYAFFYLPGESHYTRTVKEPWEYRWITFDGPMAADLMLGFQYPRGPFYAGPCTEELFESLEKRIHDATITEMRNLTTTAWQILAAAGSGERAGDKEEKLLHSFFNLVRDNYANETVNINGLSDILKVHRSTLTRIVHQHTGMSPGQYLYDFRLQKALEMLRSENIQVGEIGAACGIPDPCYFSRVIKHATGVSPGAYRRRFRQ